MGFSLKQFRPSLLSSVLSLSMILLFCALGVWQLQRAQGKDLLKAQIGERLSLAPVSLQSLLAEPPEARAYRMGQAEGRWLTEQRVLLENRRHAGRVGVQVITPLQLDDGRLLLVNRGWVSEDALAREQLPTQNPSQRVSIVGRSHIPEPPVIQSGEAALLASDSDRWPYFTLELYQKRFPQSEVLPLMLLQSAQGEDSHYIRQWPLPNISADMHIGYAIQWFAFALIWLVIWALMSCKRPLSKEPV